MQKRVISHEEHMRNIAGDVETERRVPGLEPRPNREFWYFEVASDLPTEGLFDRILRFVEPPLMKSGGAILEGCELTTTTGRRFRCLSYKGDLEGWEEQVVRGAAGLGIALGQIAEGALVIDGVGSFPIEACVVRFD